MLQVQILLRGTLGCFELYCVTPLELLNVIYLCSLAVFFLGHLQATNQLVPVMHTARERYAYQVRCLFEERKQMVRTGCCCWRHDKQYARSRHLPRVLDYCLAAAVSPLVAMNLFFKLQKHAGLQLLPAATSPRAPRRPLKQQRWRSGCWLRLGQTPPRPRQQHVEQRRLEQAGGAQRRRERARSTGCSGLASRKGRVMYGGLCQAMLRKEVDE